MMRIASIVALSLGPGAASAQTCPSFGLTSDWLAALFCEQFDALSAPTTRSTRPETGADEFTDKLPDAAWLDLAPVAEAWRSDPAKTLRLIERIRDAGGLPVN